MKLNQKEIKKIVGIYDIGSLKSYKVIKSGWINFNYDLITNKGEYILRIIGDDLDKKKNDNLKLQFDIMNYLKKKKFPYKIPLPIKNIKNNYIINNDILSTLKVFC